MAFRLKPGRSVASEIRRIVLRQIEAATVGLKAIGDPESDEAVHDARRRVKKIRAVIRLVRPALGKTSRIVDKDLRDVSRLLAPVADGQGIIATLDALERRYNRLLPRTQLLQRSHPRRLRRTLTRNLTQHILIRTSQLSRRQQAQNRTRRGTTMSLVSGGTPGVSVGGAAGATASRGTMGWGGGVAV